MRSPSSATTSSRARITRAADQGQLLVPEGERVERRLLGADRPEQRVALGQDAPASTRSRAARRSRCARMPSRKRRRSDGDPTSRSISSGRKRTARAASATDDERRAARR